MDPEKLQKVSISPEQIRRVYEQGPDAVINLVLPLVESINWLIDVMNDQNKRIKVLENQLNTNSRNSSKPPSSDSSYTKQKNQKNHKKKSKSKKRKGTTLRQVSNPDEIETCEVTSCQHCRYDLSDVPVRGLDKRQVFEIPPMFVQVTGRGPRDAGTDDDDFFILPANTPEILRTCRYSVLSIFRLLWNLHSTENKA